LGHPLERLRPCDGHGFCKIMVSTKGGRVMSIAKEGSYVSAEVTLSIDSALLELSEMCKWDLTVAQVKTTAGLLDSSCNDSAVLLTSYYRRKIKHTPDVVEQQRPYVGFTHAKRWSRRTGASVKGRIESRGVELVYPVGGEPGAQARIGLQ
jgi:hypothetical protein